MLRHIFHFVLSGELKKALLMIAEMLDFNISETIVFIIEKTETLLDHFRFFEKEKMNEYPEVNWDSHIQVYFTKDDYRKLKQVHDTMNAFSIAVVLRALIVFFIKGVEDYGLEEFLRILNKYDVVTFYKFIRLRKWEKKESLTQLLEQEPDLRFTFNNNFQLIEVEFI